MIIRSAATRGCQECLRARPAASLRRTSISLDIPHAESSRQAILRGEILRRRTRLAELQPQAKRSFFTVPHHGELLEGQTRSTRQHCSRSSYRDKGKSSMRNLMDFWRSSGTLARRKDLEDGDTDQMDVRLGYREEPHYGPGPGPPRGTQLPFLTDSAEAPSTLPGWGEAIQAPESDGTLAVLRTDADVQQATQELSQLLRSDPLSALRSLRHTSDVVTDELTPRQIDRLFLDLRHLRVIGQFPTDAITSSEAQSILEWFITPSKGRATPMITKHSKGYPSEVIAIRTCRGLRFRDFVRLSSWLHYTALDRSTFNDLYIEHFQRGETLHLPHIPSRRPILTSQIAEDLIMQLKEAHLWRTLLNLFAHPQFPTRDLNFPIRYWTPHILSRVMLAFLRSNNPSAVPPLWDLYNRYGRPEPTAAVVYHRLIEAHLCLGDMSKVRQYQQILEVKGFVNVIDRLWEAHHILDGQKQYGMDEGLERRVLENIDVISLAKDEDDTKVDGLTAELIHKLIRLRLGSNDLEGAKDLLHRFAISSLPPSSKLSVIDSRTLPLPPNRKTWTVALRVFSAKGRGYIVRKCWQELLNTAPRITDLETAYMIRHLCRERPIDSVFAMIRGYLEGNPDGDLEINEILPPGRCRIGVHTMNSLLFSMGDEYEIEGLVQVFELMQDHGIGMDGTSIKWILRCLAIPANSDPVDLAAILSFMLQYAHIPDPTVSQLDAIMSKAVRAYNDGSAASFDPVSNINFNLPGAGLRPAGSFKQAVQPLIDNVTARWLTVDSASFAYRLEFEAMSDSEVGGLPSARHLWNEITGRGYRLNKRHLLGLIKGYVSAGKMDQAESVLDMARISGNPITRGMLAILMTGYGKAGSPTNARTIYDEIRSLGKTRSKGQDPSLDEGLTLEDITAMMGIYTRWRQPLKAVELLHRDLIPGHPSPDDKALIVAGAALKNSGDQATTIEMLMFYRPDGNLSWRLRRLLQQSRMRLRHKKRSKSADGRDLEALKASTGYGVKTGIWHDKVRRLQKARRKLNQGKISNLLLALAMTHETTRRSRMRRPLRRTRMGRGTKSMEGEQDGGEVPPCQGTSPEV